MSQESFERVQNLRHLHDKTLFANACCDNNIQIVKLLSTDSSTFQNCTQTLKSVGTSLTGFRSSSGVLQRRIQNAIDMVRFARESHVITSRQANCIGRIQPDLTQPAGNSQTGYGDP